MFLLRPRSVLDIGIGFGKYGVLAREYLEFWLEHKPYEERKIRIDGMEAFPQYVNAGHRYYYDEIFTGNALDRLPSLGSYDLILLIDVLEHFTEKEGLDLLSQCTSKGKHVLVSTPLDIGDQGAVFGNEYERHRFQWTRRHFRRFPHVVFFWNYHSILCLIGPEGKKIKKVVRSSAVKMWLRSRLPGLYIFYRKFIRPLIVKP